MADTIKILAFYIIETPGKSEEPAEADASAEGKSARELRRHVNWEQALLWWHLEKSIRVYYVQVSAAIFDFDPQFIDQMRTSANSGLRGILRNDEIIVDATSTINSFDNK